MLFPRSNNISEFSDEYLIARYRTEANKQAIGILFKRYSHIVYGVCIKYLKNEDDSKDAVINIFEKLMQDLKKHDVKYFKSWIYMVSKNHCLMKLRTKQVEINYNLNNIRETNCNLEVVEDDTELSIEKEEKITDLEEAIAQLKPEQKECIKLFFLEELCYNKVAEKTGFSLKQVKTYIQNGKRNLKIILKKRYDNITTK